MASNESVRRRIVVRLAAILSYVVIAATANAQELDSAKQAYAMMASFMGYKATDLGTTSALIDSSTDAQYALNAGLREVTADLPYRVADTITIASNTFLYALNTTFAPNGDPSSPYEILAMSGDGKSVFGVPIKNFVEFNVITAAVNPISAARVEGQTLHIAPASPAGYKLYIYGPGDCTPVTNGGSLLSPVPKRDRMAAVYWAVSVLARARGNAEMEATYMGKYVAYVTARHRQMAAAGGQ